MRDRSIPWALRPVGRVHPCKFCTVLLNAGEPRVCPVCLQRPEGKALLAQPRLHRKHWTPEEDHRLRELWESGTGRAIGRELGRSDSSIFVRAKVLKLPKKNSGGGGKKYFWTPEQDQLLQRKYSHLENAIDELCSLLPMYPRWTIRQRAGILGLTRTKEPHWTKRQEKFLEAWLPHRSIHWIAKKLKRTVTAVVLKAKRLKINKSGAGYTACGLAMVLGIDAHAVARWISGGLLKATRRETRRSGHQSGDYYYISAADAQQFIKNNPDEFSIRTVAKRPFIELLAGRWAAG